MGGVSVVIVKLVGRGVGLAHHDGETWLVAGALPGERVIARAGSRRAGVVHARATGLESPPHPARVEGPHPTGIGCAGCDWSHVDPEMGAALKREVAAEAARAHPEEAGLLRNAPFVPSPLRYRLRARLHWQPDSRRLGFYRPRTWQVVSATACRSLSERLVTSLGPLEEALATSCPAPIDLEWLEDLAGDVAVAALVPAPGGPRLVPREWLPSERQLGASVDGMHRLAGRGRLERGWGVEGVTMQLAVPIWVPVGAFFQGNRHLVPWLFRRVGELAGEDPLPTWDLHAGVGLLAAAAHAAACRPLVLAETSRLAARAAQHNLPEARVAVGRTAEALLARSRRLPSDSVVLVDPPRQGLSRELRRKLVQWRPRRVVSLGCDPATWARDAAALRQAGFGLTSVELVDLFPSTHHVEVLAVLEAE